MLARYGAMTQNLVVATAYATLGTDAVVHAVNEGRLHRLSLFDGDASLFMCRSCLGADLQQESG